MQVNTRAAHDAAIARMTGLSAEVDKLQSSISTGKRIATADDDPVGAARVLTIDRRLAATASQRIGIDRASSRLNATDAALDGVGVLLQRVKEVALLGGTATLNAADRATLAAEAGQLSEQLIGYANTRDSDGASLFGGARTAGAAYAADAAGAVEWQGAGSAAVLALDSGTIAMGIDGPRVFAGLPGGAGTSTTPGPPGAGGAATSTDAFAILTELGVSLSEPDPVKRAAGLAAAQTGLDAAISRTADTRATVGTRLARLESEASRLDAGTVALTSDKSAAEGLDMAAAIARLQRLSTVLQATQLSFVKVSALNLWDYVR